MTLSVTDASGAAYTVEVEVLDRPVKTLIEVE